MYVQEFPLLFSFLFQDTSKDNVILELDCATVFTARYCKKKRCLYELHQILTMFAVYENCMMLFFYSGNSTLKVEIFNLIGTEKHVLHSNARKERMNSTTTD